MRSPLLDSALEAVGGLDAWRAAANWQATVSTGGLAFRARGRPALREIRATVATTKQRVTLEGFPEADLLTVWDDGVVRIEDATGGLVEKQRVTRWPRRWSDAEMAAFVGLALWTYASLPFVLADDRITVEPRSRRRLLVRFPDTIHTHCPTQLLHLDDAGLIHRHDYTALAFGRWARAAHHISHYGWAGGIRVPHRRRVVPRVGPIAAPGPTLVWIRLDNVSLG